MYRKERPNKNTIKLWFFRIIFVVDIVIMCIYGFLSYSLLKVDPTTGVLHDGLGRAIVSAPPIMRLIAVHEWRGLTWWIIDSILQLIMLGIAFLTFPKTIKN